jgi:uncharacterized protein
MNQLEQHRMAKDDFFRTSPESPLTDEQKAVFTDLSYYPENDALVCVTEPEYFDEMLTGDLQTSSGETVGLLRWAKVYFDVDGRTQCLTIFADDPAGDGLFLPFSDAGAGRETYGAGRYLDVERLADGRLKLDFNYAYNPNCAYNDGWMCPLTPPENRLKIPVRAGEKLFHAEETPSVE